KAVGPLDDDLVPVEFLAILQCQCHPALVMLDRQAVGGVELERAAEPVLRIVELGLSAPDADGVTVEICNQAVFVTHIRGRRQAIEQATEFGQSVWRARREAQCAGGARNGLGIHRYPVSADGLPWYRFDTAGHKAIL